MSKIAHFKRVAAFRTGVLALALCLAFTLPVSAEQTNDTAGGTQTATPDTFVEVVAGDTSIGFGTLNISDQTNTRTVSGVTYAIFESINDAASPLDGIAFDEGATNSNAYYYITYTGETYPASGGLDNTNWIFFKDQSNSDNVFVASRIEGTLTSGGGGVTLPAGVTEVGSFSAEFVEYTATGGDTDWTRTTATIYVALGDNGNLYVDDDANLDPDEVGDSTAVEMMTAKGDQAANAFGGNPFTLTSTFPTQANDTVMLDFGWYVAWDSTQGNADKQLYTLVDLPKHAAANHAWTWNATINAAYHSNP